MKIETLVNHLDEFLRVGEVPDYPNALNGLQVSAPGPVRRVGVAVDASERAIEEARRRECEILIVHHGLFWDGAQAVTGRLYRKLRACLLSDLAIYAAHIPLDVHPEVGNNVVLAREIGLKAEGEWGEYKGINLGVWGLLPLSREALTARLDDVLGGPVRLLPGGGERVERVGVITGAASGHIKEAITLGLDAFITGEGPHHTYFDATEGGLNVYYGGHYRTETWGVRALAAHLEEAYGLPWEFIDLPTGL
jgi:dinuclear metal center YbgI/SA1388 family protein